MTRRIITLLILVLVLIFSAASAFANHKGEAADQSKIPEKEGTYDDPDHPGIKVRVFIYRERPSKPAKPTPTPIPPAEPVCSADPDSSTVVDKGVWYLPPSWSYNLNPSSVPSSVGGTNLAQIAKNGFDDWSAASAGKAIFTQGPDTTVARQSYDGKNIIAWGRISSGALGATYIRYYSSSGLAVDVDTIMNLKYPWKWANSNTCADPNYFDAENILTHEQGHWIGLTDEYDASFYQDATMYGYGAKGEVKKVTLTTGDKSGAFAIYN